MAGTALDQLNKARAPKIVTRLPEGARHWGPPGASMVVSTPAEVDGLIRQVPAGKVTTLDAIRRCLARRHGTTIACPVSTAIFIAIAARASEEMRAMGAPQVTPFWRALRSDGSLNPKYPGGIRLQQACLEAEGHRIMQRGKNSFVSDAEAVLADLV
ncbi:MAG: MGMT family protein [Hyphomicrobiales bacterium]|jgi:alkylated DNA nucleotide flippase Atl1|nr:MGMT family protein [Hyphomicrobiales bacterium]